jgi:hypothetical protein
VRLYKLALLALTIMGLASQADAANRKTKKHARSTRSAPEVSCVYKWKFCGAPCTVAGTFLEKSGRALKVSYEANKPYGVPSFPWFTYSDGTADNGERAYKGAARLPKTVQVYEWTGQ